MTITANNFETLTHSHFLSACESNNLKSIQRLLTEGCCIDEVDPHGMTGLMMASAAVHIHTVKALISYGADIYKEDVNYWKAINHSTDEEVIAMLSKEFVHLEVKSEYNHDTNTFLIEVWHIYDMILQKSYINQKF